MNVQPPSLAQAGAARLAAPAATAAGALLAVAVAGLVQAGSLPAWQCTWLRWTGLPCPGCGATRCLAACGRLDFAAALLWNPLAFVTLAGLLAWALLGALAHALPSPTLERWQHRMTQFCSARTLVAAIALNWLYLCWALPR